ncbi:MAG: DsbA family protein [Pyrobaculum sp.]|nr:DsbA family protein [Pyrobaculum sp.]
MRSWITLAVVIVVFAVIVAAVVYTKLLLPPRTYTSSQGLPTPAWAISFGAPTTPITLIELYDLHCPYCATAHEQLDPLYRKLMAEGKLRLIFIDLIVHPEAVVAHQYLHCAYKQLGNKTYDLLTELYRAYLEGGAGKQLKMLQRYKCADAPTKTDFDSGVKALLNALVQKGVSIRQVGTPTFIVIKNGTINVVVGADVARVVSLLSQ